MSDFISETLEHTRIIELVRAFTSNKARSEGVCEGFTAMWLQAVLQGEKQEKQFYARLNKISMCLPGSTIEQMPDSVPNNPNPKEVIGKIYITKNGEYLTYTYSLDGSMLVQNKGSLFSGNDGKDKNLKADLEAFPKNRDEIWFKHTILDSVSLQIVDKLKQELEELLKTKVYRLSLITSDIRNGIKLPDANSIYLEIKWK